MNYINRAKLKGLMAEKNITATTLSNLLGISRQVFYLRLKGDRDFTENEICILAKKFGKDIFLK